MEWLIMGGGQSASASNLGYQEDSRYIITEECQDVLEQMLNNILQESKVKHQARRNVANSRLIPMDLIPILCHSGDEPEVFDAIVRLLMHLSMPLEVIMPIVKKLTQEDYQKRQELQKMLESIKKEFTELRVISALVDQMALIIEEAGSYPIDHSTAETLSNCLTLLRNILYVSCKSSHTGRMRNDTIISNLFTCGFDDVLKEMCKRSEQGKWLSSFLQVLHLMYKGTNPVKMVEYLKQKHRKKSQEEASQAPEECQAPEVAPEVALEEAQVKPMEVDCEPMLPSSPLTAGSSSSSLGDSCPTANERGEDDRLTQQDNSPSQANEEPNITPDLPSSPSTSGSMASPVQSQCGSSQGGEEVSGSETISPNSSRSGSPTNDSSDSSTMQEGSMGQSTGSGSSIWSGSSEGETEKDNVKNVKKTNMKKLAFFAEEYITNGLDKIIMQCKDDLKNMMSNHYFLWQMTFFLPFSALPAVVYTNIKLLLSAPVFSQVVASALKTWEEFIQASKQRNNDSKSNSVFKILNMQVSALRQMLHAVQQFTTDPRSTDVIHMKTMLATIVLTKTVRNFYHLLIRKFQPQQQTLAFLREIIMGNDLVLRIINQVEHIHRPEWGKLDMATHIRKFASRPIMRVYNYMLSKFSLNTLEENEVVMTMMHHIAVDLARPEVLYQIPILNTFACLWEAGNRHITKQSHSLIDYIVCEFCVLGSTNKEKCLQTVGSMDVIQPAKRKRSIESATENEGTKKLAVGQDNTDEPLEKTLNITGEANGLYVPRDSSDDEDDGPEEQRVAAPFMPIRTQSVEDCLDALRNKGFEDEVAELQEVLLEICYFKLNCPKVHVGEPYIWHCCAEGKSVPIIPFTERAELAHGDTHFKALLFKLGLHTSHDTGRLDPSVPAFWTSDMCYTAALTLGPIPDGALKFERDSIQKQPVEFKEPSAVTQEGVMLDLEDLELGTEPAELHSTPYFHVPTRMWCKVIKWANKSACKAE